MTVGNNKSRPIYLQVSPAINIETSPIYTYLLITTKILKKSNFFQSAKTNSSKKYFTNSNIINGIALVYLKSNITNNISIISSTLIKQQPTIPLFPFSKILRYTAAKATTTTTTTTISAMSRLSTEILNCNNLNTSERTLFFFHQIENINKHTRYV